MYIRLTTKKNINGNSNDLHLHLLIYQKRLQLKKYSYEAAGCCPVAASDCDRTRTLRPAAASQKSTCDCNYGAADCGLWWPWTVGSGSQQLELEHKE
jgi:hypothetical protein